MLIIFDCVLHPSRNAFALPDGGDGGVDEVALVLEAAPLDDVALVHRGVHALPARVLPRHGHAHLFGDAPLDLRGTHFILGSS